MQSNTTQEIAIKTSQVNKKSSANQIWWFDGLWWEFIYLFIYFLLNSISRQSPSGVRRGEIRQPEGDPQTVSGFKSLIRGLVWWLCNFHVAMDLSLSLSLSLRSLSWSFGVSAGAALSGSLGNRPTVVCFVCFFLFVCLVFFLASGCLWRHRTIVVLWIFIAERDFRRFFGRRKQEKSIWSKKIIIITDLDVFLGRQFDELGRGGVEGPAEDGGPRQGVRLAADGDRLLFRNAVHRLLAGAAHRFVCTPVALSSKNPIKSNKKNTPASNQDQLSP